MESLLFLCHRLPYPPNKGDKVRSYRFLRHLCEGRKVFLGTFVDDPADWPHVEEMRRICADVHVARLDPAFARLRSLGGLLSGEALSLPYYRDAGLTRWVRSVAAAHDIRSVFVYSSPMAQYVPSALNDRTVVDFVDMDSAKWTAYADSHAWPFSWIYRREGRTLLKAEREFAGKTATSVFVTRAEADLFANHAPDLRDRIAFVENGVDTDFFSPEIRSESPFGAAERPIVFTGAMDYWPNVDAVRWFADRCLPSIQAEFPDVRFYIVGMNPAKPVQELASRPGITVTGRVADIRPWLRHARLAVAPLRVARGIQNKVLEAMAMALPVITTPDCAHALTVQLDREIAVADEPAQWTERIRLLLDPARAREMGQAARERVLADYGWAQKLRKLDSLMRRSGNGSSMQTGQTPHTQAEALSA